MKPFGAKTDHFGVLEIIHGASVLGDVLELVESSVTPASESRADALDENEDIAASAFYGAGTLQEASTTFALIDGDLNLALLKLGGIRNGVTITSIEATTSNGGWPQIVVAGTLGTFPIASPNGKKNTFSMPSYTLRGMKTAQPIGFAVAPECRLNGSKLAATIELGQQEDGLGEPCAHGVSGGRYEVTGDLVAVSGPCGWTLIDEGLTETQRPGANEGQAAWHTASIGASGTLVRDLED